MSKEILSPELQAVLNSVEIYSDHAGIDALTIATLTANFVGLLAAHWAQLKRISEGEDADGVVKVGVRLDLDFSGTTPAGSVALSYSVKTSDEASFTVEDPNQPSLPLGPVEEFQERLKELQKDGTTIKIVAGRADEDDEEEPEPAATEEPEPKPACAPRKARTRQAEEAQP